MREITGYLLTPDQEPLQGTLTLVAIRNAPMSVPKEAAASTQLSASGRYSLTVAPGYYSVHFAPKGGQAHVLGRCGITSGPRSDILSLLGSADVSPAPAQALLDALTNKVAEAEGLVDGAADAAQAAALDTLADMRDSLRHDQLAREIAALTGGIRPTLAVVPSPDVPLPQIVSFSRPTTATYIDALGRIRTAPANAPRFDHDPVTGESLGLLIEESRTNLIRHSGDPSTPAWIKTAVLLDQSDYPAPDGGLSVRISETTSDTYHQFTQSVPVEGGGLLPLR